MHFLPLPNLSDAHPRERKKKIDKQQVSIQNQIPDTGERRTFMGYVQVTAHSEPMGDARKHLEKVA